jgi:hypothetical protein
VKRPALALSVMVLAAGCTPQHRPNSAPVSPPPAPSTAWDTDDGTNTMVSRPPQAPAMGAVLAFVHAWARPGLEQPVWFSGVRGLVTPAYARMLATTKPAHIPAHFVTGEAVVRSSNTAALVADVPTDAGAIRVTAVAVDGRWLVASAIGIGLR